jgi:bacteriorhodopsin
MERLLGSVVRAAKSNSWLGGLIAGTGMSVAYGLVLDSIYVAAIISALMEPKLCKWRLYSIGAVDV